MAAASSTLVALSPARSDQNAFNLDGIDITDNVIVGGGNQVPIVTGFQHGCAA